MNLNNTKMNCTSISEDAHEEHILLKSCSNTNKLENISFPLKSFTCKDTYILSIDLHKNKKKFIVLNCNCGIKFGRSLRTSCKHIDKISKMSFNKMIKTYEKSLIKKSIHEIIDNIYDTNNTNDTNDTNNTNDTNDINSTNSTNDTNDINNTNNTNDNSKNKSYIPIKSSTSKEEYKIYIDEKFSLICNCGMQFGLNFRKKCKHIDQISKLSLIEIQGLLLNNNPDKIDELLNSLVI